MKKIYLVLLAISLILVSFYAFDKMRRKTDLDQHYIFSLAVVSYGLRYGSPVDTKEELEKFEVQLQLFMHLDGYNAYEIADMRADAMIKVSQKHRDGDDTYEFFHINHFQYK